MRLSCAVRRRQVSNPLIFRQPPAYRFFECHSSPQSELSLTSLPLSGTDLKPDHRGTALWHRSTTTATQRTSGLGLDRRDDQSTLSRRVVDHSRQSIASGRLAPS